MNPRNLPVLSNVVILSIDSEGAIIWSLGHRSSSEAAHTLEMEDDAIKSFEMWIPIQTAETVFRPCKTMIT